MTGTHHDTARRAGGAVRLARLHVRLYETERRLIEAAADRLGYTVSEFLRTTSLSLADRVLLGDPLSAEERHV